MDTQKSDPVAYVGAAITNLLRNAFKFSPRGSTIVLRAQDISGDKLRTDVEDECGGLPPGKEEDLFLPYVQKGDDRSGMGLGLAISRQGIRSVGGQFTVRDLPSSDHRGHLMTRLSGPPRSSLPLPDRTSGVGRSSPRARYRA